MVRFRVGILGGLIAIVACAASSVQREEVDGLVHAQTTGEIDVTRARRELAERFNRLLDDPERFREHVRRTREQFPEGDLFSYTFPAIGYAQLVTSDEMRRDRALPRMAQLIDAAVESATIVVRPPGGNLTNLSTYQGHGVYLGQLNLALAWWHMAEGDDRYRELHTVLTEVLTDALEERGGRPVDSYPGQIWTIDTIPVLASIAGHDRHAGSSVAPLLVEAHRRWIEEHGLEETTGLPAWQIVEGRRTPPRGCDLSLRVALLARLDRASAEELYARYVDQFWLDRGVVAGFAEWAGGERDLSDFDSGPVFWGVGTTASAFGIAAATAMHDQTRVQRLEQMLTAGRRLVESGGENGSGTIGGTINLAPSFLTGFLYGDAVLFWAVTWQPWPECVSSSRPRTQPGRTSSGC